MSQSNENENIERPRPVLADDRASDYARYLRTDELLSLQKRPDQMVHRDELLFQTVHQSSELWLKHACWEIEGATQRTERRDLRGAIRLLRRAANAMDIVIGNMAMLEHLSPWEYQSIRKVLGRGSGFDSPGFQLVNRVTPRLGEAFAGVLREHGLTIAQLYQRGEDHPDLLQVAEGLVDWDQRLTLWRIHHFNVARRVVGLGGTGTAGTPVEVLGKLIHKQRFSALWAARDELTALAKRSEAAASTGTD